MPEEQERPLSGPPIEWFASARDGGEQGPMPQASIEKMLSSGTLTADDLVWNTNMPDWKPVRDVPELAGLATTGGAAAGPSAAAAPQRAGGAAGPSFNVAALTGPLSFFSRPNFFRAFGRICAVLAVLVGLVSLALLYKGWNWFDGMLLLVLIFFLGEAVGAVLDRLDALAAGGTNGDEKTEKEADSK